MLAYNFHCRGCGFTFMDNSKEKVRMVKEAHKVSENYKDKHCPMVEYKTNHWCRPELVHFLQIREAEINEKIKRENDRQDFKVAPETTEGGNHGAGDLQEHAEGEKKTWVIEGGI